MNKITNETIVALAKKEIDYERQVSVFGKEKADTVLSFWLLGYASQSRPKWAWPSSMTALKAGDEINTQRQKDENHICSQLTKSEQVSFNSGFNHGFVEAVDWLETQMKAVDLEEVLNDCFKSFFGKEIYMLTEAKDFVTQFLKDRKEKEDEA